MLELFKKKNMKNIKIKKILLELQKTPYQGGVDKGLSLLEDTIFNKIKNAKIDTEISTIIEFGILFLNIKKSERITKALLSLIQKTKISQISAMDELKEDSDVISDKSIYVGNLKFDVTKEELKKKFNDCGDIKMIRLRRGYGFIDFEDSRSLRLALEKNNKDFKGRKMIVDFKTLKQRYGYKNIKGSTKIFIGPLISNVCMADIRTFLKGCGSIKRIFMKQRFAFVEFYNQKSVKTALESKHGTLLMGHKVAVDVTFEKSKKHTECAIYIANLNNKNIDYKMLKNYFEKTLEKGCVNDVQMDSKVSIIYFKSKELAQSALRLDGLKMGKYKLDIYPLSPLKDSINHAIVVKGLHSQVKKVDIKKKFSVCGKIIRLNLSSEKFKSSKHCQIFFDSERAVNKAYKLNCTEFDGRRIFVYEYK